MVSTLDEFGDLMRYNNYQNDPLRCFHGFCPPAIYGRCNVVLNSS